MSTPVSWMPIYSNAGDNAISLAGGCPTFVYRHQLTEHPFEHSVLVRQVECVEGVSGALADRAFHTADGFISRNRQPLILAGGVIKLIQRIGHHRQRPAPAAGLVLNALWQSISPGQSGSLCRAGRG